MRSRIVVAVRIFAIFAFSFLHGALTTRYKIFPFEQLRTIKNLLAPTPKTSPTYSDYFYNKKSFFEQHGEQDYDVVFVGDSITDGAEWEDLFPSLKIANRGIAGDRTDGVLKRMDSIYSTKAEKAFIMIGINDFSAGAEVSDVFENYKIIANNLASHGMRPHVQSTILAGKRRAELNTKIRALNEKLKEMAAANEAIIYIDLNVGLAKGSALDSKYSRDDVHLNGSGYAVWKDSIKIYLQ